MKYDDASWHSEGDFTPDLPEEAGATHSGMFLAWALLNDLGGELHLEDCADDLESLRRRETSPGQYFLAACDGKLTDEDLNEEGNAFAAVYFDLKDGQYLGDYTATVASSLPTPYHVPDTWEVFDQLKPILDQRFQDWRGGRQR
jgi:hypothetical protein